MIRSPSVPQNVAATGSTGPNVPSGGGLAGLQGPETLLLGSTVSTPGSAPAADDVVRFAQALAAVRALQPALATGTAASIDASPAPDPGAATEEATAIRPDARPDLLAPGAWLRSRLAPTGDAAQDPTPVVAGNALRHAMPSSLALFGAPQWLKTGAGSTSLSSKATRTVIAPSASPTMQTPAQAAARAAAAATSDAPDPGTGSPIEATALPASDTGPAQGGTAAMADADLRRLVEGARSARTDWTSPFGVAAEQGSATPPKAPSVRGGPQRKVAAEPMSASQPLLAPHSLAITGPQDASPQGLQSPVAANGGAGNVVPDSIGFAGRSRMSMPREMSGSTPQADPEDPDEMSSNSQASTGAVAPTATRTPVLDLPGLRALASVAAAAEGPGTQSTTFGDPDPVRTTSTQPLDSGEVAGPLMAGAATGAAPAAGPHSSVVQSRTVAAEVGSPQWPKAVAAELVVLGHQKVDTATLRLSPEHLGPVEVHIHLDAKVINLTFGASHAETRSALEQAIPQLREGFAQAGLALGQATVQQQMRQESQNSTVVRPGDSGVPEEVSEKIEQRQTLGLVDVYA